MSACNRFVALVQCCHVPLVVVFSTNVLVGHVFRCSCAFVPNERFRLLSGSEQFEGYFSRACVCAAVAAGVCSEGLRSHASVSAWTEIASGWFETDSKDTFLPSRCDMCGLTQFESRTSGSLTWPGSCPYFQFFVAFVYSLGFLVRGMVVLHFMPVLLVSESLILDVCEASSLQGQSKVKRQSFGKPSCLKLSVQFSPQVTTGQELVGLQEATAAAVRVYFHVQLVSLAFAAAIACAWVDLEFLGGIFIACFGTVAALVFPFALQVGVFAHEWSLDTADTCAAAADCDLVGSMGTTMLSMGSSYAAAAAATPQVDVERTPSCDQVCARLFRSRLD